MIEEQCNILPETFIREFHNEESVKKMKYSKMKNSNIHLSKFGLGGSALGGTFVDRDISEYADIVETAFKNGINYIDTAPFYGDTKAESNLGKVLKIKNIPRKSFYISTKIGRYGGQDNYWFDFTRERTERSLEESLERLGLEYVDFVIAHDVEFASSVDIIVNETLPTLDKLKKAGKVKYIGFSGYPLSIFKEVLDKSNVAVDFVLSYCHYCLFDTSLESYIPYFKSKGVMVFNASPFGMALLTNIDPPSWHPASDELKKACKEAAEYCRSKNTNIAKLAMNFSYRFKDVVTTIASAYRTEFLQENLLAVTSPLSTAEEQILEDIKEKYFKNLQSPSWENKETDNYERKNTS